jgi:tetratricopeptide (TPR) repeat protein
MISLLVALALFPQSGPDTAKLRSLVRLPSLGIVLHIRPTAHHERKRRELLALEKVERPRAKEWQKRGSILVELKESDKAKEAFSEALAALDSQPRGKDQDFETRAYSLSGLERFDEALAYLAGIEKDHQKSHRYWLVRGVVERTRALKDLVELNTSDMEATRQAAKKYVGDTEAFRKKVEGLARAGEYINRAASLKRGDAEIEHERLHQLIMGSVLELTQRVAAGGEFKHVLTEVNLEEFERVASLSPSSLEIACQWATAGFIRLITTMDSNTPITEAHKQIPQSEIALYRRLRDHFAKVVQPADGAQAWEALLLVDLVTGAKDKMLEDAQRAYKLSPSKETALLLLTAYGASEQEGGPKAARSVIEEHRSREFKLALAKLLEKEEQFVAAKDLMEEALGKESSPLALLVRISFALREPGREEQVQQMFDELGENEEFRQDSGSQEDFAFYVAVYYGLTDQADEARKILEMLIQARPTETRYREALASLG